VAEGEEANSHHHLTHRNLLCVPNLPANATGSGLDAIIVPTARPSAQLTTAIGYAKELGCALLVLCSRKSTAAHVIALTADAGIDVIAIDVTQRHRSLLPEFTTDALAERRFLDTRDTATKRNLALLFADLAGWRRVFFLDDDITVENVDVLRAAARQLDHVEVAGLRVDEYPDNSVVCHAGRELGHPQQTFIGGGALAVDVAAAAGSFFPHVYNEDWFFLLGDKGLRATAIAGPAKQERYDPYYTRSRARFEEFGDTLAEGVFWLLDEDHKVNDADRKHWGEFLEHRRAFISGMLDTIGTSELDPARQRKIRGALTAALRRNQRITPELCGAYLDAWREDRTTWHEHVTAMRDAHAAADPVAVSASLRLNAAFVRAGDEPRLPVASPELSHSSSAPGA
jgi:hypothetical protein